MLIRYTTGRPQRSGSPVQPARTRLGYDRWKVWRVRWSKKAKRAKGQENVLVHQTLFKPSYNLSLSMEGCERALYESVDATLPLGEPPRALPPLPYAVHSSTLVYTCTVPLCRRFFPYHTLPRPGKLTEIGIFRVHCACGMRFASDSAGKVQTVPRITRGADLMC